MKYLSVRLSKTLYDKFTDICYYLNDTPNSILNTLVKIDFKHLLSFSRLSFNPYRTKDKVPKDFQKQFGFENEEYTMLCTLSENSNIEKATLIRKMIVAFVNTIKGIERKITHSE